MTWLCQGQWWKKGMRSFCFVLLLAGTAMAEQEFLSRGETNGEGSLLLYRLRAGESLSDIAQLFHVSLDDLAQLNQIADPRRVPIGQPLQIPNVFARQVSQLQAERSHFLTERAEFQAALAEQQHQTTAFTQQLQTLTAANSSLAHQLTVATTWRWAAVSLAFFLTGVGGWGLLLQTAQRRYARQLRFLCEENTALRQVRETYRQSVGQLELRYQKLYRAQTSLSSRSLEESIAALGRTFAQGCARLEQQLAQLQAAGVAALPLSADHPYQRVAPLLQRFGAALSWALLTLPSLLARLGGRGWKGESL